MYRAGYILLYANHLIKWCCPYSRTQFDISLINILCRTVLFAFHWLIKLPIQLAGGNAALALAVTLASNLLGILTVSRSSWRFLFLFWDYKLIRDISSEMVAWSIFQYCFCFAIWFQNSIWSCIMSRIQNLYLGNSVSMNRIQSLLLGMSIPSSATEVYMVWPLIRFHFGYQDT